MDQTKIQILQKCGAHGSVVVGIRPVTKRLLVGAPAVVTS